jgi:hypothetical protein
MFTRVLLLSVAGMAFPEAIRHESRESVRLNEVVAKYIMDR